MTEPLEVMT